MTTRQYAFTEADTQDPVQLAYLLNRLLAQIISIKDTLDSITDGTTYKKVLAGATDGSGNIDLGGTAWVHKTQDYLPDGGAYVRSLQQSGAGANYAENANFEAPAAPGDPVPGYTASNATITLDTSSPYSGTKSLRVDNTSQYGAAMSRRRWKVRVGEQYYVSAAMKAGSASDLADCQLQFLDGSGGYLSGVQPVSSSTSWSIVSSVGTVPAGAVYAVLSLQNNRAGAGTVWFDDILVVRMVDTATIQAQAVTATQIASHTITANEIAADTITASEIAANAITASELAANAVTAGKIAADQIETTKLTAGFRNYLSQGGSLNALRNPGIEDGQAFWHSSLVATTNAANAHSGNKYLLKSSAIDFDDCGQIDESGTQVFYEVNAGDVVTFRVWVYIESMTGARPAGAYIAILDKDKAVISYNIQVTSTIGSWVQLGNALGDTMPSNAKYIILNTTFRNGTGTTTARFDDLSLQVSIPGPSIVANSITANQIATDTITAAQIAANAITTSELASNAITTSKLFVGNTDNLVPDPGFEQGDVKNWSNELNSPGTLTAVAANARSGSWSGKVVSSTGGYIVAGGSSSDPKSHPIVVEGDSIYFEAWFRKDTSASANRVSVGFQFRDGAGGLLADNVNGPVTPTTSYQKLSLSATAPASTAYVLFYLVFQNDGFSNAIHIDDCYARRMVEGNIVVDGTLTASKIQAGSITTDRLTAGLQSALNDGDGNMIVNGGGEQGTVGSQATGWTLGNGNNLKIYDSNPANVKFGSRSLTIDNSGAAADSYSYQDISVNDGEIWEARAWITTSTLTGGGSGAMINIDNTGGTTSLTSLETSAPIASGVDVGVGSATNWTRVYSRFRVNGTGGIRVYAQLGYGATIQGVGFFDDIVVRRVYAITTEDVKANAITAAKIAVGTITANEIASNTITAGKLNVSTLSAITADVGTLTAGKIDVTSAGISLNQAVPGGWSRYLNLNGSGSFLKHDKLRADYDGSLWLPKTVVVLTSGTSWTVPSDFNPFLNMVECIGGGGGGISGVANSRGGGGGGGGEYRKMVAFNPQGAATITYAIGGGGGGGSAGGDTSWNNGQLLAKGGSTGVNQNGGAGGTGGTGPEFKTGGTGGNGSVASAAGGGGGGGAGGPWASGGTGNNASGTTGGTGGGGGGPNGGSGGSSGNNGGAGTSDPKSGGGAGGGNGLLPQSGSTGGNYGGGGGGGGCTAGSGAGGGSGQQGVIVITYFPIGTLP